jgi:hypothetical protein
LRYCGGAISSKDDGRHPTIRDFPGIGFNNELSAKAGMRWLAAYSARTSGCWKRVA